MTDPTTETAHRAVLTVTATSRPDGGHYFDQADFAAHVTEWVRAGLKGKHAVAEVTITAVPAVPSAAAPPTQAALQERIAEALADADGWKWAEGFKEQSPTWQRYQQLADAVLAVLPAPVDRAAVMEEGATALEALDPVEAALAGQHAWKDAAALLRRLAEAPQPETQAEESDDTVHACPGRWGGPDCRCFDAAAPAVVAQPGKENDRG